MPRIALGTYSISQLQQIIEKRRKQLLPALTRKRDRLQRELNTLNTRIGDLGGKDAVPSAGPSGRAHNARSLPETMHRILSRKGPLPIAEIVKAVKATGYKSSSPSFRAIVNQSLIKDKRFSKAERGVYQVKK